MIVCICNRLTDTMIAAAVKDGALNQADVFRRFHLRRGCSSCSVKIAQTIERARAELPKPPPKPPQRLLAAE